MSGDVLGQDEHPPEARLATWAVVLFGLRRKRLARLRVDVVMSWERVTLLSRSEVGVRMSGAMRQLPVKDRPGKAAWLGPISLCLGLLSWPMPVGSVAVAAGAVACGVLSMATRTEYRLDWTAVAGTSIGALQMLFSLMLLVMAAAGH